MYYWPTTDSGLASAYRAAQRAHITSQVRPNGTPEQVDARRAATWNGLFAAMRAATNPVIGVC